MTIITTNYFKTIGKSRSKKIQSLHLSRGPTQFNTFLTIIRTSFTDLIENVFLILRINDLLYFQILVINTTSKNIERNSFLIH